MKPVDESGAQWPQAFAAFVKLFPQKWYRDWICFLAGWRAAEAQRREK